MNFLAGYQIKKAIAALMDVQSNQSESKQALYKIKKIGSPAIPKLIEVLGESSYSQSNTKPVQKLLQGFLNNQTLPLYIEALGSDNKQIVDAITRVLVESRDYHSPELLQQFNNPKVSKKALGEILLAHHENINAADLLSYLDNAGSSVRPVIYKILDKTVDESAIDKIILKCESSEPLIRTHMAALLSRFNNDKCIRMLIALLEDSNKSVRQSALKSLTELKPAEAIQPICQLLKDPDLMVQTMAIDSLVKIRDASTVKYLIDILQDESEYVRRAAVEVLNEVGDERAIKDLLNALRDADWWVKVRAADALGSIGGPKVIDAVLVLIKDNDEFMRRTAVEILNTSKDERAFDHLVEALEDKDWWVRERAADALATLGDKRAVTPLIDMLKSNPEASQVVIKALAAIGDKRAIKPLVEHLEISTSESNAETLRALEEITDELHSQEVQNAVTKFINHNNSNIRETAQHTLQTLVTRFGKQSVETISGQPASTAADAENADSSISGINIETSESTSLNVDFKTVHEARVIDASKFKPGDMFANRYRIIKPVGKGAFGVVLLVEDTMVADEFILKFLHPHFAADKNMIKRFTQELRYARKITHENIIRIYDLINYENNYAISMEYFPSRSLSQERNSNKNFDLRRAISIIEQICSGLRAAQQVNVVHRDLKPSNILVNKYGIVKIVDFGLAAAASRVDSRLTKTGVLVGTPTYMAPEQIKAKTIDSRTDIYALGIMMYELFTGTVPYKGEGSLAVMYQHVEGNARRPSEINNEIPEAIEQIILKSMAVNPDERYQTFEELQADIRVTSGETV